MNRNRADGIVDFHHVLDECAAQADQDAGDEADDARAHRADEAAGRGDRDQARQQAVAAHRGIGLALQHPHVEDGAEGSGAARQHGVHRDRADAQVAVRRKRPACCRG